jgi:hypothetical protein
LFSFLHENFSDSVIKLASRRISGGQKQLGLLQKKTFPRQQLALCELRRSVLDQLLLFAQFEIHGLEETTDDRGLKTGLPSPVCRQ